MCSLKNVSSDDDIDDNITEDPQTIDDFSQDSWKTIMQERIVLPYVTLVTLSLSERQQMQVKHIRKDFRRGLGYVDPYFHNTGMV